MIKTVKVQTTHDKYDVLIGSDLLKQADSSLRFTASEKRGYIVYDEALAAKTKELEKGLKKKGWTIYSYPLPANEKAKSLSAVQKLYGQLLEDKANRKSILFAVGGGAIGDAVGFVAATYMRGIPWVVVPTTLLSQVDSAIGGKTAINHSAGKNLIGAFHQPRLVLCDTDFLHTLPQREVISGFGEIIKYGLIHDEKFFEECAKNMDRILRLEEPYITKAVWKSVQWKAKVIKNDEFDLLGQREALNFGHTVGHALEAKMGYGRIRHGEAVIWGMKVASALSYLKGHLKSADYNKADEALSAIPLRPLKREFELKDLVQYMKKDKKASHQKMRFVLLKGIGQTVADSSVQSKDLKKAFQMSGLKLK